MRRILLSAVIFGATVLSAAPKVYIGTDGDHMYEATWTGRKFVIDGKLEASKATYFAADGPDCFYAVVREKSGPAVLSFRNGEISGRCTEIGNSPCHVITTPHPYIFTAEYSGHTLSVFNLKDRAVAGRAQVISFNGCGPRSQQKTSHIHQVRSIPSEMLKAAGVQGEWYLASDLGWDRIHVFQYVGASPDSVLRYYPELDVLTGAGSGPRHMEFNPQFGLVYFVTELSDEVLTFRLTAADGKPRLVETGRILANGGNACGGADIHLSPDGRFLYSSHRRHNDGIAIFSVSRTDGSLSLKSYVNTGIHPRNFMITPDGKQLFVACRDSKCVQVFDVNRKTGLLKERKARLVLEDDPPMCVILR